MQKHVMEHHIACYLLLFETVFPHSWLRIHCGQADVKLYLVHHQCKSHASVCNVAGVQLQMSMYTFSLNAVVARVHAVWSVSCL